MKSIKIGLLGLGTVGRGVHDVLARNQEEITRRAGRGIDIAAVAVRDVARARAAIGPRLPICASPADVFPMACSVLCRQVTTRPSLPP